MMLEKDDVAVQRRVCIPQHFSPKLEIFGCEYFSLPPELRATDSAGIKSVRSTWLKTVIVQMYKLSSKYH